MSAWSVEDEEESPREGVNKSLQESHCEDRQGLGTKTMALRDITNCGLGSEQNLAAGNDEDDEIDSLEIVPSLTFEEEEWTDLEIISPENFDDLKNQINHAIIAKEVNGYFCELWDILDCR